MKSVELKVALIGNSRGVRIPAATLQRYEIGSTVIMEERLEGILLRPGGPTIDKLSWTDTASAMAAEQEKWEEWDNLSGDGLDEIPWESRPHRRVAEPKAKYRPRRAKKE